MQAKQIVVFVIVLLCGVGLAAFVAAAGGAHWGTSEYGLAMYLGIAVGTFCGIGVAINVDGN